MALVSFSSFIKRKSLIQSLEWSRYVTLSPFKWRHLGLRNFLRVLSNVWIESRCHILLDALKVESDGALSI